VTYEKVIVYYFSGTGNARNAAHWICKVAEDKGIPSQMINIDNFTSIDTPDVVGKTLIGFCYPTHGFNAPPILLKFVSKFPRCKNVNAFTLNTRAGMKIHKGFIPGLSGVAQFLPALILKSKGFRIVAMQPLDLPSNWLIIHPGLRKPVVDSIYNRCHGIVNDFASGMLEGERKYKALISLPIDLIISPISLGYYLMGRFFLAKTMIATKDCDSCEKCVSNCPVSAIKIVQTRPFWTYRCESCMRCVNICPQRAIETMHGFTVLMFALSSLVISPTVILLARYLGVWDLIPGSFIGKNLWSWGYSFLFLLIFIFCYRGLHFIMRFQIIDWIITYTSLSNFKFWRRYKAP